MVQGEDHVGIKELIGKVNDHNTQALNTGGIVVACGVAEYDNDLCVATVFEHADQNMYDDKAKLKEGRA